MTTRSNILIVTGIFPPDIGGPASYAQTLASRLVASGQAVRVITYARPWRIAKQSFVVDTVWRGWPRWWRHLLYFIKVLNAARSADKILALSAMNAGIAAIIAGRLFKKPVVVKVVGDYAWETAANHGKTFLLINDFQSSPKSGRIKRLDRLQRWVCRQAQLIIVPSHFLAKLVGDWGVASEKIKVIYNGVDWQAAELSQEAARKQLGIAGNIILSVGRLVPWKGFKMLIKLMPRLLKLNSFFRLVIVGAGPEYGVLRAIIKNLRLDKKVYLVGKKSSAELAVYLAGASIFVLNTGYEGFSHQLLEVMASGVPLITTRVGGNRELIKQGENGFMVNYNDEFNLYEAIKTLWQNEVMRERFITNGRITVAEFSAEKMYAETVNILANL